MAKTDYIGECNTYGVALNDFLTQFCARCLQPECTRSQHGTSKFDHRVTTWESRLFQEIPRMAETDPRFKLISSQKFIQIDTGRVPEVRSWVDPRDLAGPKESPIESQGNLVEPQEVTAPSPEPSPVPEPRPQQIKTAGLVQNTPNRRGQMVGSKKVDGGEAKPVLDPWGTQEKKAPEGKVVQPGAKIRLGGS